MVVMRQRPDSIRLFAGVLAFAAALGAGYPARAQDTPPVSRDSVSGADPLDAARWAFYSAQYESAAKLSLDACTSSADALCGCEFHTTALLFQLRRLLGDEKDKKAAWARCASCPALVETFNAAITRGQAAGKAQLAESPADDEARFLVGKLNLNYVWLHLGTIGRRTGWSEYWDARKSLDAVLTRHPTHVRARVARAWIDYIVDTKVRWGTRWLLGGGDKKKGLAVVREAAAADADFFTRAEARFALWDMQVREKNVAGAVTTARLLLRDFPENQELSRFLTDTASAAGTPPPATN
jgi:hypothetical protein